MCSDVRLSRLVRRREVATLLEVAAGHPLAVRDQHGALLAGTDVPDEPITIQRADGTVLGAVAGPRAAAAAAVLSAIVELDQERRALADEVLGLYREVNLLYALAENLAHAANRGDFGDRTLGEATRLVPADGGAVWVDDGSATVAATIGGSEPSHSDDLGRARIEARGAGAVLVAPLVYREEHRGALILHREDRGFSAADLKLVQAVAAQAVNVLERILDEERRARAAAEREEQLRRQIDRLRIELDEQRQAEQVEQITEGNYFSSLRSQAAELRRIIADRPD